MKKASIGILLGAWAISGQAQQLETDYSKYRSPIVFVLPKAPEQNASAPTQKYVAKINISADGGVVLPVDLDPPDPGNGQLRQRRRPTVATQATDISYPRYEQTCGMSEGRVTVAMKVMADGSTSDMQSSLPSRGAGGFLETALRAAKQLTAKFDEPLDKPFTCTLVTYTFKLV